MRNIVRETHSKGLMNMEEENGEEEETPIKDGKLYDSFEGNILYNVSSLYLIKNLLKSLFISFKIRFTLCNFDLLCPVEK